MGSSQEMSSRRASLLATDTAGLCQDSEGGAGWLTRAPPCDRNAAHVRVAQSVALAARARIRIHLTGGAGAVPLAVSERQEAGLVVEAVEDLVVALAQRLIAAVVLVDRVDHETAGKLGPA